MLGPLRRQILIAGITLLAIAALAATAGQASPSKQVATSGGVYAEGVVGHPAYLNPLLSSFSDADDVVVSLVFSGLTRLAPDGTVQPDLAEKWSLSPDGKTYTFQLRDATWQDGQPVTADDVVFTVDQIQSASFPGDPDMAHLWQSVKVTRVDDHTVQFILPEPYTPFLEYTTLGLLPAHILRGVIGPALLASQFNAHPVGTGPFEVQDTSLTQVTLTANPHYYGKRPFLDGITFRYYDDFQGAFDALHRGDVQGLGNIPADRVLDLASDDKLTLLQVPEYAKLSLLVLNTQEPLFADSLVRRALDLAIDRSQVIQAAANGEGVPAVGPIPPSSWAYAQQSGSYTFDQTQAAQLLDQAGWKAPSPGATRQKDGKPLHFVLLAVDQPDRQEAAAEISRQLRGIGVDAEVQTAGWTGIVQDFLVPRHFDAVLTEAYAPTADPDPFPFWDSSQIKGGLNVAGWSNPAADQLLEDGRHQQDQTVRKSDYAKFQSLFAQQQPSILLYHPVFVYALPTSLKGVSLGLILQPSDRFQTVANWYLRTQSATATPQKG